MGTVVLSKRAKKGKAFVTVANILASMLADVFNSNVANENVTLPGYWLRSYLGLIFLKNLQPQHRQWVLWCCLRETRDTQLLIFLQAF